MHPQTKKVLINLLPATAICIAVGFVFFGRAVFDLRDPMFQFSSYAVLGSVMFVLFRESELRRGIYTGLLIFVLIYLVTDARFPVTHFTYFVSLAAAVLLFARKIFDKLDEMRWVRPLVLGGFLAVFFVFATLLMGLVYYHDRMEFLPFRNMPVGFLIGLALGTGFEVSQFLLESGAAKETTGN
jgi:hypothetical protein